MGSVWRAEDRSLRIDVAVKLIDPTIIGSADMLARFEREAHAAAKLRSTHIVHINDYGVEPDSGTPYIAMDLLEGESLADRLRRQGRFSFQDTCQVLLQVAQALELAHERRIVHRDLKPENVFLSREGSAEVVKVLDFGIAKQLDARSISGDLMTRAGQLLGTPYYMSPEQAFAKGGVDHRTDIWSFGVIACECLTGRRPFHADSLAALLLSICSEPIPVPSQIGPVPEGFDAWFARAVSRNPEDRFPSIAQAATELNALGRPQLGAPTSPTNSRAKPVAQAITAEDEPKLDVSLVPSAVTSAHDRGARTKWLKPIAIAALVIGVGALACLFWQLSRQRDLQTAATASSVLGASATPLSSSVAAPASATQPVANVSSVAAQKLAAEGGGPVSSSPQKLAAEGGSPAPSAMQKPAPEGITTVPTTSKSAIPATQHKKAAPIRKAPSPDVVAPPKPKYDPGI